MNTTEAIKSIMKESGVSQAVLVDRTGIKQNTLSMRINQPNMRLRNLNEILKALNYKIIILPDTVKTPRGGYEITE